MASLRRLTTGCGRGWMAAALTLPLFAVWLGIGGPGVRYVDDLATAAVALAATVACARAARRHTGRLGLFWTLFAAATAAWALGELLWARYDLALPNGAASVVSWADVGYLGALPLAAAALLVHPALRGRAIGTSRAVLDALILTSAVFVLSWALLLGPLWQRTDVTTLAGLVTLAYPVGDVVVLLLIVLVIRGTTNSDRLDLWLLLAGVVAITFSDALYGYLTEVKAYSTGNLIDIGWFAGYLAIAGGAWAARRSEVAEPAPATGTLSSAALVVPFVPMLAALGFAAVRIQFGHPLDRPAIVATTVLVVLVLLRQALLASDLRAASGSGDALDERILAAVGTTARRRQ